ncbi:TPA: hypothetical protein DCZ15_03170 [Candidatus Falkowbacteria bacterium]|nr:MAG: hypothetical protein UV95_C0002G0020 [Candidatus Falkowbacteria bacterium GW2011_GWF2_43_32]HBA36850.1 hypothetical protein [Candidatus Falkowbacteria bacterium]
MKKILIVEDNNDFKNIVKMVINENFPESKVIIFDEAKKAVEAISFSDKDFDILLLDGDLGFGGYGGDVLNILTPEQLQKTIVCSGNGAFIAEAREKGLSIFMDKEFEGIRASKIGSYILETLKRI